MTWKAGLLCRAGLLSAVASGLAGCHKTTDPLPPSLTGDWTGQTIDFGDTTGMTFSLTEGREGTLAGTLTVVERGTTDSGTVAGSYDHPDVLLNFELTWDDDSVRGTYTARRVTYNRLEGIVRLEGGELGALTLERRSAAKAGFPSKRGLPFALASLPTPVEPRSHLYYHR